MDPKEIEALEVIVQALHECWYRDVLQALLERSKRSNTN
jgi:hypothetical protein